MGWIERREQEVEYGRQQRDYERKRAEKGGPLGTLFMFVIIAFVIYSAIRAFGG